MNYQFINQIAKLAFVEEIFLYGSRARGDHQEKSDIDIAIVCPAATEQDWHNVLDIVNSADTLLQIDCVKFDTLSADSRLKVNIIKFKKTLYCKKDAYMDKLIWKDYFDNLGNAINRLNEVLTHQDINNIEYLQDAAIQRFEFVIELYWKVLKKFLAYEKINSTTPRDVLSQSFKFNLINDEKIWLRMLDDRNNTSHVYNQEDAKKIFEKIKVYYPVMASNYKRLQEKYFTN